MSAERRPGQVPCTDDELDPDGAPGVTDGFDTDGFDTDGFDTDGDGRADTVVTDDGFDLVLLTDLDGDGLADQVLRIGPDGVVRTHVLPAPPDDPPAAPDAWPGDGPLAQF